MDKAMLKTIVRLTIPAITEYSLQTLLNYADYVMVGDLGVTASAAIGLTSEVTWLLKGSVSAVSVGVLAYIAAAIGAGEKKQIKTASVQAVFASLTIGAVMMILSLVLAPFIPVWLGADNNITKAAGGYFAVANSTFLFLSMNMVLGSAIKASGDMKTSLYINGGVNILNIILNYFLIYPSRTLYLFSHRLQIVGAGMGVYGAAAGTALSTVAGGILMLAALYRSPLLSPKGCSKKLDKTIIKEYVSVGIPSMLTRFTNSSGRIIFTAIVAQLGTLMYSAHTISFTAESAFYIPCVGMMSVVSTMAGNIKGEGNREKLDRLTKMFCIIASSVMLIMSVLMFIFADGLFKIFTNDEYVLSTAPHLLKIAAVNEPFFAVSLILESIFNGIGKTKLPFAASAVSQWTFRVGGSIICLKVLGFGVEAAWVCMISDNIFRCILLAAAYRFSKKDHIGHKKCAVE
ncbi:MAG: MATE family efflux transporter [Ruminococcus sp.]|nr:MATE family efflux transporter [Ruminococcus sp.]